MGILGRFWSVPSHQFDKAERGFQLFLMADLDMRMEQEKVRFSAFDVVNVMTLTS